MYILFSKWNENTSKKQLILDWCLLQACWMCTVLNVSSWTTWSSCVLITLTRSCSSTLWLITWRPSRRSMWPKGCSGPSYVIKTTRAAWTWLKAVPPAFSPCSMRSASTYHLRERNQKKMGGKKTMTFSSCPSNTLSALSVCLSFRNVAWTEHRMRSSSACVWRRSCQIMPTSAGTNSAKIPISLWPTTQAKSATRSRAWWRRTRYKLYK